jgi:hypothetical protein
MAIRQSQPLASSPSRLILPRPRGREYAARSQSEP